MSTHGTECHDVCGVPHRCSSCSAVAFVFDPPAIPCKCVRGECSAVACARGLPLFTLAFPAYT
eukprot:scaffold22602_cov40-Phaeocystis_antarctica.AAC.1